MPNQRGYLALIVILIISATALVVSISVSYLSNENSKMLLTKKISSQGSFLAESCLNDALTKIAQGHGQVTLSPSDDGSNDGPPPLYCLNLPDCLSDMYQLISDDNDDTYVMLGSEWWGNDYNDGSDYPCFKVGSITYYCYQEKDLYGFNMPSLGQGDFINNLAISLKGYYWNTDGIDGPYYQVRPIIDINDETAQGSFVDLNKGENNWFPQVFNKNPITQNQWTASEISDLEAGFELKIAHKYVYGTQEEVWSAWGYITEMKMTIDYNKTDISETPAVSYNLSTDQGDCAIDISATTNDIKCVTVTATSISENLGTSVKTLKAKVDVSDQSQVDLTCWGYGQDACP